MRIGFFIVIACGLAACSSNPSTKNASIFHDSLTKIAEYPFQMQSLQQELHFETAVDRAACRSLRGGGGTIPNVNKFEPDTDVKNRLNLLESMIEYADALRNASELKSIEELRAAASKMSKSFTTLAVQVTSLGGFVPSGASAIPIGGITNLVMTGIVDLRELDSRRIIRQTAKDMNALVAYSIGVLISGTGLPGENIDDYQTVIERPTKAMLATWKHTRECVIRSLNRNGSKGEAYRLFTETSIVYNKRSEMIILNKKLEDDKLLYNALIQLSLMHEALGSDDIDFQASLSQFSVYATKIKELLPIN